MNHHFARRAGATLAATALATLATGPAFAATPVASGSATAIELALAGNNTGTGTYAASTDGSTETTSGTKNQLISALSGTTLIPNTAVPAQDVATSVAGGDGTVKACAGLAGSGAGLVEVGNSGTCLTPGTALDLTAGTVDLTGLKLSNTGVLSQLTQPIQNALQPVLGPVLSAASTGLKTALTSMGSPELHVGFGAVQSTCQASRTASSGAANLANAQAWLEVPQVGKVVLANLPVNPAPNTDVVTQLGDVVDTLLDAIKVELTQALRGALAQLNVVIDATALAVPYLNQLGEQLAPLNQILSIGLNEQTKTASNAIDVTALNLKVADAATPFIGGPLVGMKVGQVSCGPAARASIPVSDPTDEPTPTSVTVPASDQNPTPTHVTSGIGSLEDGPTAAVWAALAGLTLAGTAAAVTGFRRSLHRG